MEQRLWMILQLFGGAALFLYSMDTLTDALQQAAGDTLRQALARLTAHPLADRIIATVTANRVVNIGGITFVFRAIEETGATTVDVVRAATATIRSHPARRDRSPSWLPEPRVRRPAHRIC